MLPLLLALGLAPAQGADAVRACPDDLSEASLADAIQRTVRIETGDGVGSGVVISPDGFVLTAAHVVATSSDVQVVSDGEEAVEGVVVRRNREADLALVRVETRDLPCLPLATDDGDIGSDIVAIGSPGGKVLTQTVTKGVLSGYRDVDGRKVLQTDASINAGNSGGPVLGPDHAVLGVVSFKIVGEGVEGLSFAVAASEVAEALAFDFAEETDGAFDALGPDAPGGPLPSNLLPKVEPGKGVRIATDVRYDQPYKPRQPGMWVGIASLAAGAIAVGGSAAAFDADGPMSSGAYGSVIAVNVTGWTLLATGATLVGLSAPPSPAAPITWERR